MTKTYNVNAMLEQLDIDAVDSIGTECWCVFCSEEDVFSEDTILQME